MLDVAIVLVVFAGSLTRATFGFGEAVVSMPLLALLHARIRPQPFDRSVYALVAVLGLVLTVRGLVSP